MPVKRPRLLARVLRTSRSKNPLSAKGFARPISDSGFNIRIYSQIA